jgi:beta-fructofuranosidase
VWTGSVWECPQFFPLGDRHLLLLSVWDAGQLNYTVSMTGTYSERRFTPQVIRPFDLGPDYYAPASMLDNQGRRLVWGWSWEARSRPAQKAAGWAGMMSSPRVLTLGAEGLLDVEPVPELTALRREHCAWRDVSLSPATANPLEGVCGDCLEILAHIDLGTATECALTLRRSPGAEEYTLIRYDRTTEELTLDREHASLDPGARRGIHGGAVPLPEDGHLALHVFLDRTILEVYASRNACLTGRIYPTRSDSLGVALHVAGGVAVARRLDVWRLAPAARDSAMPELRKAQ